tara:strand:+ start:1000 stop:2094 length:1095 start_codon:yes stop_codon:yes gene_type:complete
MSNNNYFYVGLVTVLLFISIVSLIIWKNSVFTRVQSYELIGEFEAINGLLENAVVKYRGYPIGRVTKITPEQENIKVYFFVSDNYQIPKGSTVKIIFDGLVGEKYMEIIPNPLTKEFYAPGARVVGYSSSGLSDFIDVGTQNLVELKSILKTMSSVFGNEEISYALKEVVFSMQDAAENMERVIDELSKISSSRRISKILVEFENLLININKAIDEDDFQRVDETIGNLEEFSRTLKDLVTDTDFKESVISTVKGTQSTFEQSSNFLNTIARIKLLTSADFNYKISNENFLMYNLNFNFWLDDTFLNFGFSNYFKEDKLVNVLFNAPFNDNIRFKYGLIKSNPGFGINYVINDPISTTFHMIYH